MIKDRDIVIIGIQPWDIEIGSNCKNIALQFARHNRVLYVNAPLDRFSLWKERQSAKVKTRLHVIQGRQPGLLHITDNLWNLYPDTIVESVNWLTPGRLYQIVNKYNNRRFAASVKKAIDELGFKDYLLFNDQYMFLGFYQKELLDPDLYVYYMRDNLVNNPYWRKHGKEMEPQLIGKADLVVSNSLLYTEYGARYNQESYMVGQGCDTSMFDDSEGKICVAEDLKQFTCPIIGYVGYLSARRLDIHLITYLATQKPDWNIVLVGPQDEVFEKSSLHQLSNVHFLGARQPEELPSYIKGFDVAINPQLVSEVTQGNYPRKIDEYLAVGKPVVATATRAMDYFKEDVYLASNYQEYLSLIEKALQEDSEQLRKKRQKTGASHSWENCVNTIYHYMDEVLYKKEKHPAQSFVDWL
ncbi:glycosyltransferase family 1 protein [Marinilabiliaceae bacterium JC017]|nr:glycosyltransferase family 1 protein [Marinilabiliaceae bacterium JC017]